MNITIYSTTTCSSCHALTGWLDKQGLDYTKLNTDEDDQAMADFMKVNDGMIGVPFSVVTSDAGETVKIPGFDQGKFKSVLGL